MRFYLAPLAKPHQVCLLNSGEGKGREGRDGREGREGPGEPGDQADPAERGRGAEPPDPKRAEV